MTAQLIESAKTRLTGPPLVLAGPMLRRLEKDRLVVWLATSQPPGTPDLTVKGAQADVGVKVRRLGEKLWVTVLDAKAQATWPPGPNTYTVEVNGEDVTSGLGLKGDEPSFLGLPTTVDGLRLAHTSCCKLHGLGADPLAALAVIATDEKYRPHVLVLSGDQIYADEVGGPVAPTIRAISRTLVGWKEVGWPDGYDWVGGRQHACNEWGFTSSAAANHLWTLGEYYAAYLLTWANPGLWPQALPGWPNAQLDQALGWDDWASMYDAKGEPQDPVKVEATWEMERNRLNESKESRAGVRTLLANVPTLMVFDDHEVTDDWNLDHTWMSTIYQADLPRQVVANGLAAYAVFQHWGNVGNRGQEAQDLSGILDKLAYPAADQAEPTSAADLQTALGLPSKGNPTACRDIAAPRYDLRLGKPEGFPVDLTLLDERTCRSFDDYGDPDPGDVKPDPKRMSRIAKAWLPVMVPAGDRNRTHVVVAPAPVLGYHLMEHWIQPVYSVFDRYAADAEAWSWNPKSLVGLLDRLAETHARTVILSGDLHFAWSHAATVTRSSPPTQGEVVQLVASAVRNADVKTLLLQQVGDLTRRLGFVAERTMQSWLATATPASRTPDAALDWEDQLYVWTGLLHAALAQGDRVFSEPLATAIGLTTPPTLAWVQTPLVDDTTPPPTVQTETPVTASHGWGSDAATTSAGTVKRLQKADLVRLGTITAGVSNLGVVSFAGNTVTQRLLQVPDPGPQWQTVSHTFKQLS